MPLKPASWRTTASTTSRSSPLGRLRAPRCHKPLLLNAATGVAICLAPTDDAADASGQAAEDVANSLTRAVPEPRWAWSDEQEAEHFGHGLGKRTTCRLPGEDAPTDARLFEEI